MESAVIVTQREGGGRDSTGEGQSSRSSSDGSAHESHCYSDLLSNLIIPPTSLPTLTSRLSADLPIGGNQLYEMP
jgi:hypothetical protein